MAFIFPLNEGLTAESTSNIIVPLLRWLFPFAGDDNIRIMHIAFRKTAHFFNYAFLSFLLFRAIRGKSIVWRPRWLICAGVIAISYSALDETIQALMISRTGSVSDCLINTAGVFFMLGIIYVKGIRLKNKVKEDFVM